MLGSIVAIINFAFLYLWFRKQPHLVDWLRYKNKGAKKLQLEGRCSTLSTWTLPMGWNLKAPKGARNSFYTLPGFDLHKLDRQKKHAIKAFGSNPSQQSYYLVHNSLKSEGSLKSPATQIAFFGHNAATQLFNHSKPLDFSFKSYSNYLGAGNRKRWTIALAVLTSNTIPFLVDYLSVEDIYTSNSPLFLLSVLCFTLFLFLPICLNLANASSGLLKKNRHRFSA